VFPKNFEKRFEKKFGNTSRKKVFSEAPIFIFRRPNFFEKKFKNLFKIFLKKNSKIFSKFF